MFGTATVSTDHWRNYIPFAPDLEATVIVGKDVFIDMKPHLVQGARDYSDYFSPDPTILPSLVDAQRGWLLDMVLTNTGKRGEAVIATFRDGFTYKPYASSPSTTDCFNYQLSNGTQLSNYGKITVTIIRPIDETWNVFSDSADVYLPNREKNNYSMTFDVAIAHPSIFLSPAYKVRWHVVQPVATKDDDGITRVRIEDKVFDLTTWYVDAVGNVTIVNTGKALPMMEFKKDSDIVGLDVRTNAPYRPQHKFPDVYVEYINYPHKVPPDQLTGWAFPIWDTSRPDVYVFKIEDTLGSKWYRAGTIKIV